MNAIFQPVVGKIVDLVRTQVNEVKDVTSKQPKVITNFPTRQLYCSNANENRRSYLLEDLVRTTLS